MTAGFQFPDVDEHYGSPEDPDLVNHPAHYQSPSGLEVFDVIEAFCPDDAHRSHATKYLLRAGKKNGYVEDLQKCIAWCERAISFHEKRTANG